MITPFGLIAYGAVTFGLGYLCATWRAASHMVPRIGEPRQ